MNYSSCSRSSCKSFLQVALLSFLYVLPAAAQTQTATPTIRPLAGIYLSPQIIRISDATPGAVIYYTIDGTTPTTASTRYTAPLSFTAATTVQALAVAPGNSASLVEKASYRFADISQVDSTLILRRTRRFRHRVQAERNSNEWQCASFYQRRQFHRTS